MATAITVLRGLRERNLHSMDVLAKALQRLKELRSEAAANPQVEDRIEAEISTLDLELRISTIVHTRLQAASVAVEPLPEEDAERLDELAATIDEAIERDALVNATFATVMTFIATAKEVRELVKSSTNA